MLKSSNITNLLIQNDLSFITGVPCSTFKDFLIYLNAHENECTHVRTASEGEAIGVAAGYHLATNKIPVVYMQNSGLGNAVNPLTSLADPLIYGIPMVLFISWRAQPGKHDEPQHVRMGKILPKLLKVLNIPYEIADTDNSKFRTQLTHIKRMAKKMQQPVALIFGMDSIEKDQKAQSSKKYMLREEALNILLNKIGKGLIVSTTGKTSRELFELRVSRKEKHDNDFMTVGSLGCASGIGLGISLSSKKPIHIIDGDGSVLMKMGGLTTIGHYQPKKFYHFLIDNESHESTGGQPTASSTINWQAAFAAVGYQSTILIKSKRQLETLNLKKLKSPAVVIIKTSQGSRPNLGRPTSTPHENKQNFMEQFDKKN